MTAERSISERVTALEVQMSQALTNQSSHDGKLDEIIKLATKMDLNGRTASLRNLADAAPDLLRVAAWARWITPILGFVAAVVTGVVIWVLGTIASQHV